MKQKWIFAGLLIGGALAIGFFLSIDRTKQPGRADKILVEKAKRQLHLIREGKILKTYPIALGGNPLGTKTEEGDQKTPEGLYFIDGRNPDSAYHLSLRISYPNAADKAQAKARGVSAGFDIMIHGRPNGSTSPDSPHWARDWTAGCVAVDDAQIEEIWASVSDGTPIEIRP